MIKLSLSVDVAKSMFNPNPATKVSDLSLWKEYSLVLPEHMLFPLLSFDLLHTCTYAVSVD